MFCRYLSYKNEAAKRHKRHKMIHKLKFFLCAFCAFVPFCGLFYEAVADGVVGQLGVGSHVHLVEDPATIRADGLLAER